MKADERDGRGRDGQGSRQHPPLRPSYAPGLTPGAWDGLRGEGSQKLRQGRRTRGGRNGTTRTRQGRTREADECSPALSADSVANMCLKAHSYHLVEEIVILTIYGKDLRIGSVNGTPEY